MALGSRTDTMQYDVFGQRASANLMTPNYLGQARTYTWFGDRMLEEYACHPECAYAYALYAGGSYYGPLLARQMGGMHEYPLYDGTGTARGTVNQAGAAQYSWDLDAFGRYTGSYADSTWFPYRFGGVARPARGPPWRSAFGGSSHLGLRNGPLRAAAVGSPLVSLSLRPGRRSAEGRPSRWPEIGRSIQQDPIGEGMNWYAYVDSNPLARIDPEGLWGMGVGVSSSVEDTAIFLGGASTLFGGAGLFWDKSGNRRWGAFAGSGSFSYGPLGLLRMRLNFPRPPWGSGEYVGAGYELWCTNANKPSDLAGPFMQFSIHLGIPGFPGGFLGIGVMGAWDQKGTAILAVSPFGMGFGIAMSLYETYTYTTR